LINKKEKQNEFIENLEITKNTKIQVEKYLNEVNNIAECNNKIKEEIQKNIEIIKAKSKEVEELEKKKEEITKEEDKSSNMTRSGAIQLLEELSIKSENESINISKKCLKENQNINSFIKSFVEERQKFNKYQLLIEKMKK